MGLKSQTKCDNMFSDPESNSIVLQFLAKYLIYIFFSYVVIIHLFWRQECVGIYCKLIPDLIKSTQS